MVWHKMVWFGVIWSDRVLDKTSGWGQINPPSSRRRCQHLGFINIETSAEESQCGGSEDDLTLWKQRGNFTPWCESKEDNLTPWKKGRFDTMEKKDNSTPRNRGSNQHRDQRRGIIMWGRQNNPAQTTWHHRIDNLTKMEANIGFWNMSSKEW